MVLIALVITTIFGVVLLFMTNTQTKLNSLDKQSKISFEYAESGYNKYLWHLNDDPEFYLTQDSKDMMNKDIEFQNGFYRLEVERPDDEDRFVVIKSTGWTKENPDIKRTIIAKIRKKQFVHHVYVSDSDGDNIWWTKGDESLGPLHTNKDIRIQQNPIFYDTVSYSGQLKKGTNYSPDFKVKNPLQPEKTNTLDFPNHNKDLKTWAEKDNMVFKGRTCIYLDGKNIKIRNGNDSVDKIKTISISSIKNKVIYVEKDQGGGTGKFDIKAGNIFISGELEGELTIGAENNVYITYDDPTNWYDYDNDNMNNFSKKPNQPPQSFKWSDGKWRDYPEKGGIRYSKTTFSLSNGKMTRSANGDDMLGLIANNEILILHYGWPKRALRSDLSDNYWNFKWRLDSSWFGWNKEWVKESYEYDFAPQDITIHAALFSINSGFGFESYNRGNPRGEIKIWGNITQRERLPVGSIGSNGSVIHGYNKEYIHDPRMLYNYPPHIIEPTNVGWEIHEWKEVNDHVARK